MNPRLAQILTETGDVAVAVSGGIDSLTLAMAAVQTAQRSGARVEIMHASSAAVPPEATARVKRLAAEHGWSLRVIEAGEFSTREYVENPANRCLFCKNQLYSAMERLTDAQLVSGANLDDLGDYRPGLDAARAHQVRHPYIEAGIGKAAVRQLARELGLGTLAELPASPCLSSRIETGIRIEPMALRFVHEVERLVAGILQPSTVRCRVRASGVVVELDEATLMRVDEHARQALTAQIRARTAALSPGIEAPAVSFAAYRMGSAFVRGTGP
ncbi:adenine nucleotide alpha hydrolase [Paraburkholderia sp. JPY432]|uniref:adenine nucleotide alpha hydrolase n=1 Tax=Paraburkholderia youngii TaxID=2782701 RepID=UPI001595DE61|nr:adenine nucleotide alpha hydrolase [Paraburkholderia youngii]NVH77267.1 adenine nucleotide alpha hydrolase [Paraburkholderia youngii]